MPAQSHFIDGKWIQGAGSAFRSIDPATGQVVWEGAAAMAEEVDHAVGAARRASESWADTSLQQRIFILESFARQLKENRSKLAEAISHETGKPTWEALGEVDSMIGKVPVSIEALSDRRRPMERESAGGIAATRFKPHGVVAVFGPFNFPGHLPNGHIVPALLAGNTVVFKPSEAAPLVTQTTVELWEAAGLPSGVLNLVQGARETGAALAKHAGIDGLFFTGSAAVGKSLSRAFAEHPEKILALEMGGNNPMIVHEAADLDAAAYLTIQSAYITAGQRCTCARRLIVPEGAPGDAFIERLVEMTRGIRVGRYTDDPEPFMGPVISVAAADRLFSAQEELRSRGGQPILEMKRLPQSPAMASPGLIDVTAIPSRSDEEIFGPLLQLIRVPDFAAAIDEANRTSYGLAAGLLSDNKDLYEQFFRKIRAGVVNWNRQTTGASGALPFGGVGQSGNHRPSGYYAADYCSYPVASLEIPKLALTAQLTPGILRSPA
ncbi:MAG TPA: succinylglutamate-semialdehyde dehydrogenase [Tepidisphaeraceae bacterium]|nr:succinylglutamate-semialdehyde dehydrogenase [Tepidisphaeraceae bacterium]